MTGTMSIIVDISYIDIIDYTRSIDNNTSEIYPYSQNDFVGCKMDLVGFYRRVARLEIGRLKPSFANLAKPTASVLVSSAPQTIRL